MDKKELLLNEIEQIPESYLDEVFDFIQFLKTKMEHPDVIGIVQKELDTTIASESSLKKDWLNPVEDEAWKNL